MLCYCSHVFRWKHKYNHSHTAICLIQFGWRTENHLGSFVCKRVSRLCAKLISLSNWISLVHVNALMTLTWLPENAVLSWPSPPLKHETMLTIIKSRE